MTTPTKSVLALFLAVATGCSATAVAAEPIVRTADVTCHGKAATYVGTEGDDVLTDEETDFGRNPVIVLGGGNDELTLGSGYREGVDSLVVCAGDGNDTVHVTEGIGGRAQILLDGGRGDDIVGNDGGSKYYSDIPTMNLIGGGGDDMLRGGNSDDRISGDRGDDVIYGVGGNGPALRWLALRPDQRRARRRPAEGRVRLR